MNLLLDVYYVYETTVLLSLTFFKQTIHIHFDDFPLLLTQYSCRECYSHL